MKLPIRWLKEYIEVKPSPEKLAELFTMSGTAVERVEGEGADAVLDIEVTTNRPDCLSILGLAREFSALSGKKINFPKLNLKKKEAKRGVSQAPAPTVHVQDRRACPRYTARLLEGVTVKASPAGAAEFLKLAGARPINAVVDATNFVLFETGQPLHAFDYDKIRGHSLIVRRARKGEKLLGIDGVEYALDERTLVIADAESPVAIAGVIGGKLTEVTAQTKNILLESAYFDPALVRRAARLLKVSTESSYRFERGVNSENTALASSRAAGLILEWAGGRQTALPVDRDFRIRSKPRRIALRPSRVEKLLGVRIPENRISAVLKSLGFTPKPQGRDGIAVQAPAFRPDVREEADLVEEILRIEGFDKIPATLPPTRHPAEPFHDRKAAGILELKKFLAAAGFQEITTYSLLSSRALSQSGFEISAAQRIVNPASAEQEYLRPSLLPGMLQAVAFNAHRKASSLKLFEIGNCFAKGSERTAVAFALYGRLEENWRRKNDAGFFDLKGAAENALAFLGIRSPEWGEGRPGTLMEVKESVLKSWDIPKPVFYFEAVLDDLFAAHPAGAWRFKPVPKFPSVRRDVAFVVGKEVSVGALAEVMRQSAAPYLQEVTLFDEFTGKNIPVGKRSLAFTLAYQKQTGTFTDEEIQALQSKVGAALKEKFRVEFR